MNGMESKSKKQQSPQAIQISEQRHYSGPLPMPEDLAKYDQVVPGAAERIIQMAEKEMQHRHENDNRMAKSVIWTTIISIIFAFLSVLILSSLVFFALDKGYDKVAATMAVGSIAAVAGVFIFFKKSKNREG